MLLTLQGFAKQGWLQLALSSVNLCMGSGRAPA